MCHKHGRLDFSMMIFLGQPHFKKVISVSGCIVESSIHYIIEFFIETPEKS